MDHNYGAKCALVASIEINYAAKKDVKKSNNCTQLEGLLGNWPHECRVDV
jgi:hypothetical protein